MTMILMQYGDELQRRDWIVEQETAAQFCRIYLMDGGEALYEDAVTRQKLKKGKLYVFPAQQPYRMTHNPDDPIRCLWMHADVFPHIVSRLTEIDPTRSPDLAQTLELMRRQIHREDGDICVEIFARAVLQLLIRDGVFSTKIDSSLVEGLNLATAGSVAALSRRKGYTEEHFIRIFRKAAGVTPYQYILSQRMNEAISLMMQGYSMDEVASRVGYASGKSFSGAFKRRFGIPPDVYRENFLKRA